jgi:hypothetical protein
VSESETRGTFRALQELYAFISIEEKMKILIWIPEPFLDT